MNKETLQKQVEEMKVKLAEMEAELNKQEEVLPKVGDWYWIISSYGSVEKHRWVNDRLDVSAFEYKNFYQTEEEAIKARDIQLAKIRLTNRIKELNDGWYPDWSNEDQSKYYIVFNTRTNKICVDSKYYTKHLLSRMYIKSRQIAEQILSEMEDDIRLVLGE